jgi:hypothetical protein
MEVILSSETSVHIGLRCAIFQKMATFTASAVRTSFPMINGKGYWIERWFPISRKCLIALLKGGLSNTTVLGISAANITSQLPDTGQTYYFLSQLSVSHGLAMMIIYKCRLYMAPANESVQRREGYSNSRLPVCCVDSSVTLLEPAWTH